MSAITRSVAMDVRMLDHSGIGTVIRGLLSAWEKKPPPFELTVLHRSEDEYHPALLGKMKKAAYDAPIYGTGGLLPAPVGDAQALLGTHYTAPILPRRSLVCIVHDLIHVTHPSKAGMAAYMKTRLAMLRKRAEYVITPSRHTKVQLQTLHGFKAHRVLTLPWGCGVAELAKPEEVTKDLLPQEPFLLAVGIFKPHKNLHFLMRRIAGLYKYEKLVLPLVVAGLRKEDRQPAAEVARQYGIQEKVTFLPRLTDGQMASVYESALALVFPSLVEGFGFPVVEALAMGTPVVAADLPPMNEFPHEGMQFFDPDSPESFDSALMRVIDDGEIIENARAGRDKVRAAYSWDRLAIHLEDILSRAISNEA